MKNWAQIGRIFGGTTADKNVSNNIKRAFTKWLLPYERTLFPDEAMSGMAAHGSVSTPRRKRPQTNIQGSEKKQRSMSFSREEKLAPSKPDSVMTLDQSCAPPTSMPPTQRHTHLPLNTSHVSIFRSYVSIPHSTESKYCIILLPTTPAQELSQESQTLGYKSETDIQATNGVDNKAELCKLDDKSNRDAMSSLNPDQFTVSLLMNHPTVQSSDCMSQIPVMLNPRSESDINSGNKGKRAPGTCSGLVCMINNSISQSAESAKLEEMAGPPPTSS